MAEGRGGDSPDRDGPDGSDPWDGITFDEDFVRGSTISEPAAEQRRRDAEKASRRADRDRRRRARRRRAITFVRRYTLLWVAAAIVIVLVALGTGGTGPLGPYLHDDAGDTAAAPSSTTLGASADTTSTTFVLMGADHPPGTCLIWNQELDQGATRRVDTVPCDEPHLFETTAQFELEDSDRYGDDGPTDEQWDAISEAECGKDAQDFLGYPLDPHGRFGPSLFTPTRQGWRAGDRHVYCGIASTAPAAPDPANPRALVMFTGAAEGADQSRLFGTGTCATEGFGLTWPIDCSDPHVFEVIGSAQIDLPPDAPFPGDAAVMDAVAEPCRAQADTVYGRPLDATVNWGILYIAESSWAAGRRTVECLLGRIGADGGWEPVAGPLRG